MGQDQLFLKQRCMVYLIALHDENHVLFFHLQIVLKKNNENSCQIC